MGTLTKEQFSEYKEKLAKGIAEYMSMPASDRTSNAVRGMIECWLKTDEAEGHICGCSAAKEAMTDADAKAWAAEMKNEDGSNGPHWDIEQTTAMAESSGMKWDKFSKTCWWIAMNMMYSDYCDVAMKYGVSIAEFYADMARAFLMDRDGPGAREKLSAYYHGIVK